MYYPYIRAKAWDLAAIVDLNNDIYDSGKVKPIIEPTATIKNQYQKLLDREVPFILVVNPIVGPLESLTPQTTIVDNLVHTTFYNYDHITLGFIIHPETTLRHVKDFIEDFPKFNHAFIHFSQFHNAPALAEVIEEDSDKELNIFIEGQVSLAYINEFLVVHTEDVLIRDGFMRQAKNELYPASSFFSDLHQTYSDDLGYDGFGDFTITGSDFFSSGGPAYVVALHLTDQDERGDLIIRHFKSDTTPPLTLADVAGKFSYALNRLNRHFRANPGLASDGITFYKTLHRNGNFPGLGTPKKLSIMHHIELIYNQL